MILCDYCSDTFKDIFQKEKLCPICSEGKPRGSDYSQKILALPISNFLSRKLIFDDIFEQLDLQISHFLPRKLTPEDIFNQKELEDFYS